MQTALPVSSPFSLEEVVVAHGWWEVPPFRWKPDVGRLLRADRVGNRSWLASVVQRADDHLEVDHDPEDEGAVERMRTVLSLEVPGLSAFQDACRDRETLRWVPECGAGRFLRGLDAWEDASKAVCFTNLKWAQAARSLGLLSEAGPLHEGLRCWPEPEELLERGEDWMRDHARIGYRARSLLALARGFVDGTFERDRFGREDFRAMPGIGPATSAYLAGMWGDWRVLSFDSSIAAMLRDRDGLEDPQRSDAEHLYGGFGVFQGLACLLDVSGWRRGLS